MTSVVASVMLLDSPSVAANVSKHINNDTFFPPLGIADSFDRLCSGDPKHPTTALGAQRLSGLFCAAIIANLAQAANSIAIGRGQQSVIIPLLNTSPLFTVFFNAVFLRNLETVNSRMVLGAVLRVGGVALIALIDWLR